jgi:hypothetical protein
VRVIFSRVLTSREDAPPSRKLFRKRFFHTHLVRGGSVMLQPTESCSASFAYPPRQRWVLDASAYKATVSIKGGRQKSFL